MKPYLILFSVAVATTTAGAQQRTMVVNDHSSNATPIELSTATRITFSQDMSEMLVTTDGQESPMAFNIDDIAGITFTLSSGIDQAVSFMDGLEISNAGGIVTITATGEFRFSVWTAAGQLIGSGTGDQCAQLDFTDKAPGMYIIKANDKTLKFINR